MLNKHLATQNSSYVIAWNTLAVIQATKNEKGEATYGRTNSDFTNALVFKTKADAEKTMADLKTKFTKAQADKFSVRVIAELFSYGYEKTPDNKKILGYFLRATINSGFNRYANDIEADNATYLVAEKAEGADKFARAISTIKAGKDADWLKTVVQTATARIAELKNLK